MIGPHDPPLDCRCPGYRTQPQQDGFGNLEAALIGLEDGRDRWADLHDAAERLLELYP
jgi:hypothetical protein